MKRIALFTAAIVVASSAASAALAGPGLFSLGTRIATELNLQTSASQPREAADVTTYSICPDISLVSKSRLRVDGTTEIAIIVQNRSAADYLSGPGQQALVVRSKGGGSGTVPFVNVRRGETVVWNDVFRPGRYPGYYEAYISLDPDLYADGNNRNDDCRADNNRLSLTIPL